MRKNIFRSAWGLQIIIAILLIQSNPANSQIEKYQNLPQYLNPDFIVSRVKMKVGKDLNILLNYNLVTERMVFFQKEQAYDLLNQGSVDTIYMNGSRFIPYEKAFFEVIPEPNLTFFIQHRGRILPPAKPAAYGGTSEVSSSTYLTRIDLSSGIYNMKLDDELRIKFDSMYWVRLNGNMMSFTNEKQLLKLFPGKEESIKQYIRKNRLKFEKREDLLKICAFCSEIMK
jgi:hypothetical protein